MSFIVHCLNVCNDTTTILSITAANRTVAVYLAIEKLIGISNQELDSLLEKAYASGIEAIDAYKAWALERELWIEVE